VSEDYLVQDQQVDIFPNVCCGDAGSDNDDQDRFEEPEPYAGDDRRDFDEIVWLTDLEPPEQLDCEHWLR
jgi:hypothetical protein